MARIIYALSGQGRGHTSRVIAVSDALRQRGHEVLLCCGGTAREIFADRGECVIPVPALRQVMQGNEVQHAQTIRENLRTILRSQPIVEALAEQFARERPDLVITDFEAFAPRAARRLDLPVISFNHQQVVTETRYRLPVRYVLPAMLSSAIIRRIAPSHPAHLLLTSFFFPPLKHPRHTTLVPPIIRSAVQELHPKHGEHVLVYYNQPNGAEHVLETLRQVDASFVVYNFDEPPNPELFPNVQFKRPCLDGFLDDLAASRAVLCTAGFTLISEALYLGKPLLVVPNRGIFEQTLNALFLQKEGLGMAVIERVLTPDDVRNFLNNLERYERRLRSRPAAGNDEAVACIEEVLRRTGTRVPPHAPQERDIAPYTLADPIPRH